MNPATDPTGTAAIVLAEHVYTLDWRHLPPSANHPTLAFKAQATVRLRDDARVLGWIGYREHATLPLFFATGGGPTQPTPTGLYTDDLYAATAHVVGQSLTGTEEN